jgi:uncharacterized protein DUF4154
MRKYRLLAIAMIFWTCAQVRAAGGESALDKNSKAAPIEAAYIYNLCLFTEWPASAFQTPDSPVVIGVAGRNAFIDFVADAVRGRTAHGRTVEVIRIGSPADAQKTHMLFLGFPDMSKTKPFLDALRAQPVVTVGDGEGFAEAGGMIGFFRDGNHVRYAINLESAHSGHIEFQFRLLALARIVH